MIAPGVIFDSASNFEIFKTEMFYNFGSNENSNINATDLWFHNSDDFGRSFSDKNIFTSPKPGPTGFQRSNEMKKSIGKKHKKKKHVKHKIKKCLYKLFKGKRKKFFKSKKFIMSLFMGILLAKSLFIPIVLKTLALIAAKGLIMGFFSTLMASVISLKGMFGHSYGHRNRKDDGRTRVEIVHVPGKHENIYYERPFRRSLMTIPIIRKV